MSTDDPVSLLGRGPLPDGVDLELIVLKPGESRPVDPGRFIVVERGEVEIGGRRFVAGDVLTLARARELANPCTGPALIAVASRRS